MSNTTAPNFAGETFKQVSDAFTKSVQIGVKFTEDAARFWSDSAARTSDEFRNRVEKAADETTPLGRKNVERFQRLFEEQGQRSTNLFRQTLELNPVLNPATTPAEWFDRGLSLWKASFETMRESAEAFNKHATEVFTDWSACAKRCEARTDAPAAESKRQVK